MSSSEPGFTIPNLVAIPTPRDYAQAQLDTEDLRILTDGDAGTGVISGLGVTLRTGLSLNVASGSCLVGGSLVSYGGGFVTLSAAASLPRFDLVVMRAGAPVVIAGTPATAATATTSGPALPARQHGDVVLCSVYVDALQSVITALELIDKRVFLQAATGLGGTTVDTGEAYRIIMLSDGTVKAIPVTAVPPVTPTGVTGIVRLTSVNLSWPAVSGANSFIITRDGVQVGTTSSLSFRDTTVLIGSTYQYRVASVDSYGQRSPSSTPFTAFIDPALNQAPTDVSITVWPAAIPTDGPAWVRVNAREIDVQVISYVLNVDAGSLTATFDPSVYVLTL